MRVGVRQTLYVLDRPNPLGGKIVDGAVLDAAFTSFVGIVPCSIHSRLHFGRMAMMINGEGWLQRDVSTGKPRKCPLTIIRAEGWQRWMTILEDTDFTWIPTSPHIPNRRINSRYSYHRHLWRIEFNEHWYRVMYRHLQMFGTPTECSALVEGVKKQNLTGITMIPTRYRPFTGKFCQYPTATGFFFCLCA